MLYALLMLGLLPAVLLLDNHDPADGAEPADGADDQPADDADDQPGDDLVVEDIVEPDSPPVALEIPLGTDQASISGFRPGIDTLTVAVESAKSSFCAENAGDHPALRIEGDEDECLVAFRGLDEVPLADISISVTDPFSGEVTTFRLSDLGIDPNDLGEGDTLTGGDNSGIDPNDPGEGDTLIGGDDPGIDPNDPGIGDSLAAGGEPGTDPNDPGEGDTLTGGDDPGIDPNDPGIGDSLAAGGEPGTEPNDPEVGDTIVLPDPDDGTAIDPNDPAVGDVLAGGGDDGLDPNDPGIGDSVAGADPSDSPATGPSPGDAGDQAVSAFRFDAADGAGAAVIAGFVPGADILSVMADVSDAGADLAVDVRPSDDGADGEVWIGGALCAILKNAPNAGTGDLHLEVAVA